MAHFALTKPGGWATLYVPVVGDYNDLDQKTFKSINGDDGGTWTPSAPIIVGGSGMQIPNGATWTVLAGGTLSFTNATLALDSGSSLATFGTTTFKTSSLTNWNNGAIANVQNGAFFKVNSGGLVWFQGGSTLQIDNGTNFLLNGGITAGATGSISMTSAAAGSLLINGNTISINDGTNPTFASTRTRSIMQPMVPQANTFSQVNGSSLNDNGAGQPGNTTWFPLTKLINAARWNSIVIKYNIFGAHTPTTAASVTLVQVDTSGNVVPYLTVSAATGVTGVQTLTMSLTGLAVFVDDSNFTYYLKITAEGGSGAASLSWFCPKVTFDTIQYLGQF